MRRSPVVTFLTYNSSPTDLDCFYNQFFKERIGFPNCFTNLRINMSFVKFFVKNILGYYNPSNLRVFSNEPAHRTVSGGV